jgi:hypothetical protein
MQQVCYVTQSNSVVIWSYAIPFAILNDVMNKNRLRDYVIDIFKYPKQKHEKR